MSKVLPKAVYSGVISLPGGCEMDVHVLDDGQRVIGEAGLMSFLEWLATGEATQEQMEQAARDISNFTRKGIIPGVTE